MLKFCNLQSPLKSVWDPTVLLHHYRELVNKNVCGAAENIGSSIKGSPRKSSTSFWDLQSLKQINTYSMWTGYLQHNVSEEASCYLHEDILLEKFNFLL